MLRLRKSLLLAGLTMFLLWSCEGPEDLSPSTQINQSQSGVFDEFVAPDGCANCEIGNAVMPWGAERAVLLFDSENHTDQGATANTYVLTGPGAFHPCEDGTATMTGEMVAKNNVNDMWSFEVYLSDGIDWATWSGMGGNYVTQGSGIDVGDLFMDWTYYVIDPNQSSTMTGMGDNAGTSYSIVHKPYDYSKRVQVGYGANTFNYELGLLGWFAYVNEDGSNPRQGDFILEISCEDVPPPSDGCTHTIGFWKTHAGLKKQDDEVTQYLPLTLGDDGGDKSISVTDNTTAVKILNMKTYGSNSNGITKLYAQLLAAKLSIADGADSSPVSDVIADADSFLADHDWNDWYSFDKDMQSSILDWQGALDDYNNGETDVPHCD